MIHPYQGGVSSNLQKKIEREKKQIKIKRRREKKGEEEESESEPTSSTWIKGYIMSVPASHGTAPE
jgi:hypothetical protein